MNATYYLSYRRKRCTELPQILPDDRLRRLTVDKNKLPAAVAKTLRQNGCQIIEE